MAILDQDVVVQRRPSCKCISCGILVLAITIISIVAASLNRVASTEYGLQYNVHKKILAKDAKAGGLYLGTPGYKFVKFPSTFITVELPPETCVSRDGLRVSFAVTFQYKMPLEWIRKATIKYRNFEKWSEIVVAAGNSAVQHSCSDFNTASFQNQRGAIQSRMEESLRTKLEGTDEDGSDGVYARAISLQLRDVQLPEEYNVAVQEKQSAEESIALAQNQRLQETTKANTLLLAANEEARKIDDTAVNDAFIALTEGRIKANATKFAFGLEAEVIKSVKDSLGLSIDGVLAFLYNQLLEDVPNLKVSAAEPAQLSRREEISSS